MNSNTKSILFLIGRFTVGGVERVTVTMANAFSAEGWRVCVVAFKFIKKDLLESLDKRVVVDELCFPAFHISNVKKLKCIMELNGTRYIVNQWALPFPVTAMLRLAKPRSAKLIAFHHTMPNRNGRLQCAYGIKKLLLSIISQLSLRLVYRFSDAYVVLSPSLMPVFKGFTGLKEAPKLTWLPNPLSDMPCQVDIGAKENAILFVGRLSQFEKRVDRILQVWGRIADILPDWRLDIVGDGPDRLLLESMAQGMPRVTFHGFQNAMPYYSKSKILLLTSDFEGFAMVLVEAMAHGCVPVAFGSYPTVNDIIHGDDGIVVPEPWDVVAFYEKVLLLARDDKVRMCMAEKAMGRVQGFFLSNVLCRYLELLHKL